MPEPVISSRVTLRSRCLMTDTDTTVAPSMSISTSARKTSPTLLPAGNNSLAPTPLGAFAPAWRQVKEPSSRVLVTSMSNRRAMGFTR